MSTTPQPPAALPVLPANLPTELIATDHWVAWTWQPKEDKDHRPGWTKVPLNPCGPQRASSTDDATWGTFDTAWGRAQRDRLPGIGFVFSADDPFTGIDLDKCIDAATGEIAPWAQAIIDRFATYTEVSPSGTGVHLFVKAVLPDGVSSRRRSGQIEMYSTGRYFTTTGQRVPNTPPQIAARQPELDALYAATFGPEREPQAARTQPSDAFLGDEDVLARARDAANGGKFQALWAGDTRDYAGDDSAADLALLSILSFWTQDEGQLDQLFRRSGLYREKWERSDYRAKTIQRALDRSEFYTPNGHGPEPVFTAMPEAGPSIVTPRRPQAPWPTLDDAALYGLPGDIVRAIDPHTEGDPAATLINFLLMFGSAAGAGPHTMVGDRRHHANENAVLVGDTSKGRKGTSHDTPEAIVREASPGWELRVQGGLSSGEGVIWAVRDPIQEERKGEVVTVDLGEPDKRLLIVEEEYAAVLKVASREGNTLSEVIRRAWDSKPLQIMTKNRKARCEHPHVAILAHVTQTELRRELTDVSAGNGFANRFLWVCVKRSKKLPDGGALPLDERQDLVRRTARALQAARGKQTPVRRSEEARAIWHDLYGDLSEAHPGLWGAITDRAEAHVLRLSLLYAMSDGAHEITADHLIAALALWDYCADSAKYIFGDSTGDPIADRVLHALRTAPLAKNDIMDLFGRNVSAARLDQALATLATSGLAKATLETLQPGDRHRPRTIWTAT